MFWHVEKSDGTEGSSVLRTLTKGGGGPMSGQPTFSLQWHITAQCDQRCKHCYLFNSPDAKEEIRGSRRMTLGILQSVADNLIASCKRMDAVPRVFMTGGDPILSPHFWDLLEYLHVAGIRVSIMGNPYHITDDSASRIRSLGVLDYQMSLDGLEPTHDTFRKRGSFTATLAATNVLKRNNVAVAIMTTVSKQNAGDIPELTRRVVNAGVDSATFARYCPTATDALDMSFQPLEYRAFLGRMWEVYDELSDSGTRFPLKDHLWNLFLMERGLFQPEDTGGIVVAGCGMAVSHLTVLADGTVYACRRFKSPIGKVPEDRFDDLFFSEPMNQFREPGNYEQCGGCVLYNYCRGCSAVSHCVTGSWKSADPQCWK